MSNAFAVNRDLPLLGSVAPADFIGRDGELSRLLEHAKLSASPLLVLAAPASGTSEMLRQAYDELFAQAGAVLPIYFAWTTADRHAGTAARHFAHDFLRQFVAFRRQERNLCRAQLSAREIIELAPARDHEWLERFWEAVEAARREDDEAELVSICLSAPQRARRYGKTNICVFFDQMHAADWLSNGVALGSQIIGLFSAAGIPTVLAGYRRQLLGLAQKSMDSLDGLQILRLEQLSHPDVAALLERLAARADVEINDECRDLLVEQTDCSPVYLRALVDAAKAAELPLNSFRNCQEIYARELLGGRINRIFNKAWEEIVAPPILSRQLLPLLCGERKTALDYWRKRLKVDDATFNRLVQQLHAHEWLVVNGANAELRQTSRVWRDYVSIRCRLEVAGKPRAQVMAAALADFLKRAPQIMNLRYRRASVLPIRETLTNFDGQTIPYSLFDAHHYALLYEDLEPEEVLEAVRREDTRVTLPQIVNLATCASYQSAMKLVGEAESCLVAHGFTGGRYTNDDEIIWITAQLDSKNPAGRGLVKVWHEGLRNFAVSSGLTPLKCWLIAPSGFTPEARAYLAEHGIYSSDAIQLKHLQTLLTPEERATVEVITGDDFELVIPMSEDSELVATSALEQIASRLGMPPAIVNQIKTALVEACINATEHSHSPDRKIYQRFTLEPGKLTITVASRGITQPHLSGIEPKVTGLSTNNGDEAAQDRRGWGLKLIRSLMDEVEFDRVDDGTRLRMTKFYKQPANQDLSAAE